MSDKVMIFKSLNGMDYIGKLVKTTDTTYEVKGVYALVVNQDRDGVQVGMGAAVHPALGKVDQQRYCVDMTFERTGVVFTYEPTKELEDDYLGRSSGIQLAKRMPGNL